MKTIRGKEMVTLEERLREICYSMNHYMKDEQRITIKQRSI